MINEKFYFIENKNKNGNYKFNLYLKLNKSIRKKYFSNTFI